MNGAPTHLVLFVCVENTFRSVIAEAYSTPTLHRAGTRKAPA